MKNHYALVFAIAVFSPALAAAQYATNTLNINDVEALFHANGLVGQNYSMTVPASPGYFVPNPGTGTGPSPLFAGNLWVGGLDSTGTLHLAAEKFEQQGMDWFPGPLGTNAGISGTTMLAYNQLWKVNRADVMHQIAYFNCLADPNCDEQVEFPGYTVPSYFYNWPAHGDVNLGQAFNLADFYDYNQDGLYNPDDGDAPCVPGDQALFSIFNDNLETHGESGGQPIGLEVQFTPFAYNSSNAAVDQTVFIRYRIINRGALALHNTYIGLWNDYDIGGANDDYVQCDVGRSLFYGFNGDLMDEDANGHPGYGANPPAFGEVILQGPHMDADGVDNTDVNSLPGYNGTGFNDGIVDNEHLGMSHFVYFNNTVGATGDPDLAQEFYNYLEGHWKDGTPFTYSGTGYSTDSAAIPTNFMFPGNSDPLGVGTGGTVMPPWSELTEGNMPGDRRALATIGPFTLSPGQQEDIVVAYVFTRAMSGGVEPSVQALKNNTDSIRAFAEAIPGLLDGSGSACDQLPTAIASYAAGYNALRLFPNPATDQLNVVLPGGMREGVATIYDAQGRVARQQEIHANEAALNTGALAPGIYMLRVRAGMNEFGRSFVKAQY